MLFGLNRCVDRARFCPLLYTHPLEYPTYIERDRAREREREGERWAGLLIAGVYVSSSSLLRSSRPTRPRTAPAAVSQLLLFVPLIQCRFSSIVLDWVLLWEYWIPSPSPTRRLWSWVHSRIVDWEIFANCGKSKVVICTLNSTYSTVIHHI